MHTWYEGTPLYRGSCGFCFTSFPEKQFVAFIISAKHWRKPSKCILTSITEGKFSNASVSDQCTYFTVFTHKLCPNFINTWAFGENYSGRNMLNHIKAKEAWKWVLFHFSVFSLSVWELDNILLRLWTYGLSSRCDTHMKQFSLQWSSLRADTAHADSYNSWPSLAEKTQKKRSFWILCCLKPTTKKPKNTQLNKDKQTMPALVRFLRWRKTGGYCVFIK